MGLEKMTTVDKYQIKTALISVSDKKGIVDFAKSLSELGIEIYSTGGTAKQLEDSGINEGVPVPGILSSNPSPPLRQAISLRSVLSIHFVILPMVLISMI